MVTLYKYNKLRMEWYAEACFYQFRFIIHKYIDTEQVKDRDVYRIIYIRERLGLG